MDRLVSIVVATIIGLLWLLLFSIYLKKETFKNFCIANSWMHPNSICYWRMPIGWLGLWLYFFTPFFSYGIILFTFSAFLDATDGQVARKCGLITEWGKELDPLADKLTYLPAMLIFGIRGEINLLFVLVFIIIEVMGQFGIRSIAKIFGLSVAANNFGKIKACLCFTLIIYLALLDDGLYIPNFSYEMLCACILMGVASGMFKLIPNRLYANILSSLNLICGIIGICFAFNHNFVLATIAILIGQIFDLFDGRMADKHGGTPWGPYIDDVADFVSFGICGSLVFIVHGGWSLSSIIFGFTYLITIAYRLWRFTKKDKFDKSLPPGIFNGLPSPAGVMIVLGAYLLWKNTAITHLFIILASALMISNVRFAHFGRYIMPKLPRALVVIFGLVILVLIAYFVKAREPTKVGMIPLCLSFIYLIGFSSLNKKIKTI